MDIIAYIFIGGLFLSSGMLIIGLLIEKNFNESHPIKKWWRKHIISNDPYYDIVDQELDNKDNME